MTANIPDSWNCIDCGRNTAPGFPNRVDVERAQKARILTGGELVGLDCQVDEWSEVYHVRSSVWTAAGMSDFGGCLCIGCLERRLGRQLRPRDFVRSHPFNAMPGTPRLLARRDRVLTEPTL
jgi:hypothetical protein